MLRRAAKLAVSVTSDVLILPPINPKPLDLGVGPIGSDDENDSGFEVDELRDSSFEDQDAPSYSSLASLTSRLGDGRPTTASSEISSRSRSSSSSSTTSIQRQRRRRFSSAARHQSLIRGAVTLTLSKPRTLSSLRVDLVAYQSVLIDGCTHSYGIRQASSQIDVGPGQTWPEGIHTFPFALAVPSTIAPTDSCPYGRTSYKLIAVAPGLHKMGRNGRAETPMTIVASHDDGSGLPPSHSLESELYNENLGRVRLDLSAQYLLVGGLLDFSITMPNLKRDIKVEDVSVDLVTTYRLRALSDPVFNTTLDPVTHEIYSMKADPRESWKVGGRKNSAGSTFALANRVIQLADETSISPTVPDESVTGIKVSHRLGVTVTYTPLTVLSRVGSVVTYQEMPKKEYKITTSAIISSCRCTLEALQLPAYSTHTDDQQITDATISKSPRCLCMMSIAEKKAFYGIPAAAARAGGVACRGRADSEGIPLKLRGGEEDPQVDHSPVIDIRGE